MRLIVAVLVQLFAASVLFSGGFNSIPLNHMLCVDATGTASDTLIIFAHAYRGGLRFSAEDGTHLTTLPCIAHPDVPANTAGEGRAAEAVHASIQCSAPLGDIIYFQADAMVVLKQGVWEWYGDDGYFVSTMDCEMKEVD